MMAILFAIICTGMAGGLLYECGKSATFPAVLLILAPPIFYLTGNI